LKAPDAPRTFNVKTVVLPRITGVALAVIESGPSGELGGGSGFGIGEGGTTTGWLDTIMLDVMAPAIAVTFAESAAVTVVVAIPLSAVDAAAGAIVPALV
jgi:hypothetical protein